MPSTNQRERNLTICWTFPRLYISAYSNSCQLVPLHPIIISILFHHYKELKESIAEVERIEGKVNNSKDKGLMEEKEEKQEVSTTTTLDSYFIRNNNANL